MYTQIQRWLDTIPLRNPLEHRQASMFQLVLIAWIALAGIGTAAIMASTQSAPSTEALPPQIALALTLLLAALALLILCPIIALVLLRRGHFQTAVRIAAFGMLIAHINAHVVLGFSDPSVLTVYQLPIALAGLLAGRRLLWAVVGLSMLAVITIGVLQSLSPPLAGFLAQPGASSVPMGQVVGFYIVITVLVALLLDRFGGALREALTSSLEREEELRGIRASLESSVAARTAELQTALRDVQAQAAEQRRLLAENDQQRTMLQELSVPVIPISADTLVMPLVGALDSARLMQLQEQSLRALDRTSARTLVLDITGVPVVDSQVAQGLLMTVRSARLLGAHAVLVGIRPEVAQTIVGLGIDLRDVRTYSDLQSALNQSLS
jgi:rsbT co-antagonist protein RsbR